MNAVNVCDAIRLWLEWAASQPEGVLFVRKLNEQQRAEAAEYIRGLAEHVRQRRSVPIVPATNAGRSEAK